MFAYIFTHGPNPDTDGMREQVRHCLTSDDSDARRTWNALMQENRIDIWYQLTLIRDCLHNGLVLNPLLKRRLWDFVYKNTMIKTDFDQQEFENSHEPYAMKWIDAILWTASDTQEIVEQLQDEQPIAGLQQFYNLCKHTTAPRGRHRHDEKKWQEYIDKMESILHQYRGILLNAKDIMRKPHNHRFVYIVASILVKTEGMMLQHMSPRVRVAGQMIEDIRNHNTPSREDSDLDDEIVSRN